MMTKMSNVTEISTEYLYVAMYVYCMYLDKSSGL